jgi:hypothetical protein
LSKAINNIMGNVFNVETEHAPSLHPQIPTTH